ncbi:hypothetical protein TPHA_0J01940 [Tetrapisispora phaffii CBS 4417]|uniref:TBP-associated factor 6 n=1 Tax=Tetrapisispora phaffii (strain ATCC 24235 / CBS 4417 / NBRC 1672 / NRRL Y-8282 / UCD 70-5) TaxID=1071381 RepID=G8BYS3_TETPH|nr:hypothetical protein TPHA_0J01940 [Tetrapisispora phaffii CBS 4417]CCE65015.1 hypothetical protein TPHA_0J01940 [Tetrapisispora phaffii CBS 4417]
MSNPQQSYSIWSPHDTVKDVAESLGVDNINEDVLKSLAMDVEYRILEIIEQAVKFKRHSKRDLLTTDDIAKALRILNVEPLYGYHDGSARNRSITFNRVSAQGGQSLYYVDDEEVDFDKLINEPLPQVPRLPTFTTHWLAVEGIQPAIAQNPNLNDIRVSQPPMVRGAIVTALNDNSIQSSSSTAPISLSEDKDSYQASTVKPGQNTEIKPLVKHVLSKELQIYFNKVVSALTNPNIESEEAQYMKAAALSSLKTDSGLHQLVPYFIQFIAEQITHHLSDLDLLSTILEMIYALLSNESIFLDPYIHSLMPSILTLLLAKKIGGSQNEESAESTSEFLEKTNALRDFAASLLDYLLKKYPQIYKSLKPRVTRTLLKTFLDTNRAFGTYYGCLRGISVLEAESIRFFLGNLHSWSKLAFAEQNIALEDFDEDRPGKFTPEETRYLINMIINCLLILKDDLPQLSQEDNSEVTDEEQKKLVERCGVTIAHHVLKRDDSKALIQAIFFGE